MARKRQPSTTSEGQLIGRRVASESPMRSKTKRWEHQRYQHTESPPRGRDRQRENSNQSNLSPRPRPTTNSYWSRSSGTQSYRTLSESKYQGQKPYTYWSRSSRAQPYWVLSQSKIQRQSSKYNNNLIMIIIYFLITSIYNHILNAPEHYISIFLLV